MPLDVLRVLLVEDDAVVLRALDRFFQHKGHHVVGVSTVSAALEAGNGFDAAVLDVDLPDGSGVDLGRELITRQSVLAVIFYSGASREDVPLRASEIGPFVHKAESIYKLYRTVLETAEEARRAAVAAGAEGSDVDNGGRPGSGVQRPIKRR
jgi:DNA-binding response OmpR family regulator